MSEDNIVIQNQTLKEKQDQVANEIKIETQESEQNLSQNDNQGVNESSNQNDNQIENANKAEPVFGQTQSKVEATSPQPAAKPSLKDLKRQIAVLTVRIEDANQHSMVREDNLRKSISDLTTQNALLRSHLKSLDNLIKKLSLLHSQLTAAPNYKLAKQDVEEMIRLVSNL